MSGKSPKRAAPKKKKAAKAPAAKKRSQPESFRATTIQAALTVKDLGASVAWYTEALGFVVSENHMREGKLLGVSLKAGSTAIVLTQDDGAKGLDRVKGEGMSLQFTTTQDIDALAARATARGVQLTMPPTTMPWGPRVFRVTDPDGFKLVITSPRK